MGKIPPPPELGLRESCMKIFAGMGNGMVIGETSARVACGYLYSKGNSYFSKRYSAY